MTLTEVITLLLTIVTATTLAYKTWQESLLTRERAETEDTAQARAKVEILEEWEKRYGELVRRLKEKTDENDTLAALLDSTRDGCLRAVENTKEEIALLRAQVEAQRVQLIHRDDEAQALVQRLAEVEAQDARAVQKIRAEYEAQIAALRQTYERQLAEMQRLYDELQEKHRQALRSLELKEAELLNTRVEIAQLKNGSVKNTARALGRTP